MHCHFVSLLKENTHYQTLLLCCIPKNSFVTVWNFTILQSGIQYCNCFEIAWEYILLLCYIKPLLKFFSGGSRKKVPFLFNYISGLLANVLGSIYMSFFKIVQFSPKLIDRPTSGFSSHSPEKKGPGLFPTNQYFTL